MSALWYALVALVLLAMAVSLVRSLGRCFSLAGLCALIVTAGLVYDNTVIAAGSAIGAGSLLEGLSWVRFLNDVLATPLLVMYAWDVAARAGMRGDTVVAESVAVRSRAAGAPAASAATWARTPAWRAFFAIVTLALVAYGVIFDLIPLTLEPETLDGVLSYAPAGSNPFPLPAAVTTGVLLAVGIWLWRVRLCPWLAVATVVAAALFWVALAIDVPMMSRVAEVVLIGGLLATELWLVRRELGRAADATRP